MGKPTGFIDYEREDAKAIEPKERIKNFKEFHIPLSMEKQQIQGARCMNCGVPFCQNGSLLAGMTSGCPLHNLVPETNDLIYRGNWKQASVSPCRRMNIESYRTYIRMNLRFTYSIIPVKSFATTRKPGNSCMTELLIPPPNRRTSTVLLSLSKAKKDSTSYATAAKEDSSTLIPKTGHGKSCSNRTTRSTP